MGQVRASQTGATVIDRQGNTHEVRNLVYQGRDRIEYYVQGDRRVVPLRQIDRIRFEGEAGAETQTLTVAMRNGQTETGTIVTGAGIVPHEDVVGGATVLSRFTGSTSLGPFFMQVGSVREVILHHQGTVGAQPDTVPKATVVLVNGQTFPVGQLRFRNGERLEYTAGRAGRFVDLSKVASVEFAEGTAHEEVRPVTITLWSGRTLQGTMDAGRVRLQGETDRAFYERVQAAFTGSTYAGRFTVGLHDVKLIRFHRPEEASEATAPPGEEPGPAPEAAPPEAPPAEEGEQPKDAGAGAGSGAP